MKTFVALFISSATFSASVCTIYWYSSHEYAGLLLLGLMTLAMSFAAGYAFLAERESHLAGDNPQMTHQQAAGEDLGIVTKESAWPIVVAFSVLWLLIGMVWSDFMIFTGVAALLIAVWRLGAESARISHRRIPAKDGGKDIT